MRPLKLTIALLAVIAAIPASFCASAQSADSSDSASQNPVSGSMVILEANHRFGDSRWYGTLHLEHNSNDFNRLDNMIVRSIVGYKFTNWFQAGLAYDLIREPDDVTRHRMILEMTGTLKSGNMSASIRERYLHDWDPSTGKQGDMLRSRLKVQYDIPESKFSPSLAVEVFSWGDTWYKSRHFVTMNYKLTDYLKLSLHYILYVYDGREPKHCAGLSIIFNI